MFATQTMKGAKVLDTANHPRIQFTSTRITGTVNAATVQGNVTIRGITRPLTLNAQLFRQHSTSLDDLSVLLTGSIDRNDFGADGFASYVGPRIDLKILARISK